MRHTKKVWVVEDDDAFALIIRKVFGEHTGIEVDVFRDGTEAVERVKNATVRLAHPVLLDLDFDYRSGFEVLEATRTSEKQRSMPIISLTHTNSEKSLERACSLGANNFLLKDDRLADTLHRMYEY